MLKQVLAILAISTAALVAATEEAKKEATPVATTTEETKKETTPVATTTEEAKKEEVKTEKK